MCLGIPGQIVASATGAGSRNRALPFPAGRPRLVRARLAARLQYFSADGSIEQIVAYAQAAHGGHRDNAEPVVIPLYCL